MLTPRISPEALQELLAFPGGLLAVNASADDARFLVVKATKEHILAAKLCGELKVYVVGFSSQGEKTAGLGTAIFDDADEPLFIGTPLVASISCESLRVALLQPEIDVHFFDEHGRELLGYRAAISMPQETRSFLASVKLFPATTGLMRAMLDGISKFMGERTVEDDEEAITVSLLEPLVPEDIFFMEARPNKNAFNGSPTVRHTSLVRPEPGRLQEWDVIDLLQRTFEPSCIFHGPLKLTDGEEIADVVVVTGSHILVVQAKDSPNTEHIAKNKLSRKRATAMKSLDKALAQVRGAVRYMSSAPEVPMLCGEQEVALSTKGRFMFALVVCKELFSDQYVEYSRMISATWTDTGVPCVALDYIELTQFTSHVVGEEPFFEVLNGIHRAGQEGGQYPRPRFGLPPSPGSPHGTRSDS